MAETGHIIVHLVWYDDQLLNPAVRMCNMKYQHLKQRV
jgi:hypothetical protein